MVPGDSRDELSLFFTDLQFIMNHLRWWDLNDWCRRLAALIFHNDAQKLLSWEEEKVLDGLSSCLEMAAPFMYSVLTVELAQVGIVCARESSPEGEKVGFNLPDALRQLAQVRSLFSLERVYVISAPLKPFFQQSSEQGNQDQQCEQEELVARENSSFLHREFVHFCLENSFYYVAVFYITFHNLIKCWKDAVNLGLVYAAEGDDRHTYFSVSSVAFPSNDPWVLFLVQCCLHTSLKELFLSNAATLYVQCRNFPVDETEALKQCLSCLIGAGNSLAALGLVCFEENFDAALVDFVYKNLFSEMERFPSLKEAFQSSTADDFLLDESEFLKDIQELAKYRSLLCTHTLCVAHSLSRHPAIV